LKSTTEEDLIQNLITIVITILPIHQYQYSSRYYAQYSDVIISINIPVGIMPSAVMIDTDDNITVLGIIPTGILILMITSLYWA
jgi:hypothetical protein